MKAHPIYLMMLLGGLVLSDGAVSAETRAVSTENEAPLLTVRELTKQGQHFKALSRYEELDETQRPLAEKLAAAKSAWALGLTARARSLWDEAFAFPGFEGEERNQEILGRAILELQESHFEEARSLAEQAIAKMEPSETRAQFQLVAAEALSGQGAQSQAEAYYKRAVEEASGDAKSEASYLLAECQLKLGLINDARYNFANVETRSPYTSKSLRRLTEIDLSQRNYEGVLTWVDEGRSVNPQEFEDTWVGYARVTALLELKQIPNAVKELERLRVRYSDKDPWVALASAKCEAVQFGSPAVAMEKSAPLQGRGEQNGMLQSENL